MLYGSIEAGGTKFVLAVADEKLNIIQKEVIPTTQPVETMEHVFSFFDRFHLAAIGIGSFGPIGVNPKSDNYGYILSTPKKGWAGFDMLGIVKDRYNIPIGWTTDVNAAALGELKLGAARGSKSCIYLTIGTGIGGGFAIDEEIYSGLTHPELGHIYVKRHMHDSFEGNCPFHKDCLEGMAAGPAIEARTQIKGELLASDHPVWELQAFYIAQALVNFTLSISPERIILGGGVMNQDHLLIKIRESFLQLMNGYVDTPPVSEYIQRWGLPNESGVIGGLLLAQNQMVRRTMTSSKSCLNTV